jgi:uncharacterized membrane protein YbhN (UPF0104 family)
MDQAMTPAAPPARSGRHRAKKWLSQIVGLLISVACLTFVFRQLQLAQLRSALTSLHWPHVAAGIASLACGYLLRIKRWAFMLNVAGAMVTSWRCAAPFLGSITLNNVLPFRAGDFIRVLIFPQMLGVRRLTASASLLLERLIDLLTLLLSLGLGLWLDPRSSLPSWLGRGAMLLAAAGSLTLITIVLLGTPVRKIIKKMQIACEVRGNARLINILGLTHDLLAAIDAMARLPALGYLLALSILIWTFESGLFWALLSDIGLRSGAAAALTVMAMVTLSTLLPSSPGYVGPFHLAAYSAASMLGASAAQAAIFAMLAHLGVWLPTTLAGSLAILLNPRLFNARPPHFLKRRSS